MNLKPFFSDTYICTQSWLHRHAVCAAAQDHAQKCPTLNFLTRALHFHFVVGPTNYVDGHAHMCTHTTHINMNICGCTYIHAKLLT